MRPVRRIARLRALASRESGRFLKFLVVGTAAFLVDIGSLSAFVLFFGVNPTVAKGLAFVLAVFASFIGNHFWTYRDSHSRRFARQLFVFSCVSLVGLGINLLVFYPTHAIVLRLWGKLPALYAAEFSAVGVSLVWNFVANRFITYGDVR